MAIHKPSSDIHHQDELPTLYQNADQQSLSVSAAKYLNFHGTEFHQDVIVGALGPYIYTAAGRRILDWTSGQMACLLGHGNPEIVEVITKHAMHLDHLFSGMISPPVISLAERLCNALPPGLDRALFLSTGGESNEAAIKMAKMYTGKFEVVALGASWHGMTGQAIAAQFHFGRKGHGPLMPGMHMLPRPNGYRSVFRMPDGSYDWKTELDYGFDMIDSQSCGSLAACIVDIAAFEEHGIVPDILTLSKTLGNGLPLSAVVTSDDINQVCKEKGFFFVTTHVNDPIPAAVGDKVLEIILRDNVIEGARKSGERLFDGLYKLKERYGCIGDVRGRCLLAGVEIVTDRESKTPALDLAAKIGDKAYELGVWANLSTHQSFGGVFRIAPPITATEEQIDEGLDMLERAFASVEGTLPLYH
ncbi:hypothetical protein FSHL1_007023 [Fusarium sambucinum]